MPTKIRDSGYTTDNVTDHDGRWCFTLSNGNALMVIRDATQPNAAERLLFYESADRTVWTLRQTVIPASTSHSMTATVDSANNVHVVMLSADRRTMRYNKVNYSGWGATGWEQVANTLSAGAQFNKVDIDVSDPGQVFIASTFNNGNGGTYGWIMYVRHSGNTWVACLSKALTTKTWVAGCETVSICATADTVIGGVNYTNVAVAIGWGESTADKGVYLYAAHVRPTTGLALEANSDACFKGAILAGEANNKSTFRQGRLARFFRDVTDPDAVVLGVMHAEKNRKVFAVRYAFSTGFTVVTPIATAANNGTTAQIGSRYMGMTYSAGVIVFAFGVHVYRFGTKSILIWSARLTEDKDAFVMTQRPSAYLDQGYLASQTINMVLSGGQRNGQGAKGDLLFQSSKGAVNRFYHEYAKVTGVPKELAPKTGSTTTSSNPTVSGLMDFDRTWMQIASTLEFQFATDASFTTGEFKEKSPAYDVIDGTDKTSGSIISLAVSGAHSLTAGQTWYMRARNVDSFGNTGAWTAAVSFSVSHPPSASDLTPSNNKTLAYGTAGKVDAKWVFNDSSATDVQTAYQIQVTRVDNGSVVLDTGKVASANKYATLTIPVGAKNVELAWRIKLWDSFDTPGEFSGAATFALYDGPVVTVSEPTPGAVVVTPVPHVKFTVTTAAGATIKNYEVVITQSGDVVWSSGIKNANGAASGTEFTVDAPGAVYRNTKQYTIMVRATDSRDLQTTATPRLITASWPPPPMPTTMPTADVSSYNVEDEGYVKVEWDASGKDPDFVMYSLQRRDDLMDTDSETVLDTGEWVEIAQVFENDTNYEYHDVVAPSNYRCSYRVAQGVARFGDVVLSEGGAAVSCFPQSDSYWFVDPTFGGDDNNVFKLFNVTSDAYTEEYERAEYFVIGRGNHVDKGERMGYNGSLTAQIRHSGATTARQKKLRLEEIQKEARNIYLRTPFGDVFYVSVGIMSVTRIAGVGLSEFVDISIPYLEVGTE